MLLLYGYSLQLERRNQRYYSGRLGMTAHGRYSKEIGIQGFLSCVTDVLTLKG